MSLACISRLEPDAAEEPPHEKHQVNRFLLQQSSQAKDNKMTTIARLIAAMQQNYALIMDADKNPYDIAPPPRSDSRSWSISPSCWTTIFCATIRNLDLVSPFTFVCLILGIAVTGMTFEIADRTRRRAMKIESVSPKLPKRISVAP